MNPNLAGRKLAILVADGFEMREMSDLKDALDATGAQTCVVALALGQVQGWEFDHLGKSFPVDATVSTVSAVDFDALLLPGAVCNAAALRDSPAAAAFVSGFFQAGKPVAAIGHGLQGALKAGVVRDRTVTSLPSLRSELVAAGAVWVDAAVVVDRGLVTSRSLADWEDFQATMIAEFIAPGGGRFQRA